LFLIISTKTTGTRPEEADFITILELPGEIPFQLTVDRCIDLTGQPKMFCQIMDRAAFRKIKLKLTTGFGWQQFP